MAESFFSVPGNSRLGDGEELRPIAEAGEQAAVRPGEPSLHTQIEQGLEQSAPAVFVEMGRYFVEQQQRPTGALSRHEARLTQKEGDQKRLLFAGGAIRCRHMGSGEANVKVAAVGSDQRAARLAIQ